MTQLAIFRTDPRDGFRILSEYDAAGRPAALVIPTNLQCRTDGSAVMGAGLALAAVRQWPRLDAAYGAFLASRDDDRGVAQIGHALLFPTKYHWRERSSIALIAQSCDELLWLAEAHDPTVYLMPRVGCGLGGLHWDRDVLPLLNHKLEPIANRVVLVGK